MKLQSSFHHYFLETIQNFKKPFNGESIEKRKIKLNNLKKKWKIFFEKSIKFKSNKRTKQYFTPHRTLSIEGIESETKKKNIEKF